MAGVAPESLDRWQGGPFPSRTTLWGKDDKKEDEIGFVKALGYNKRTVE